MTARFAVAWALLSLCVPAGASEPDLTTPRRAYRSFLDLARAGEFAAAAGVLDLGSLPGARRANDGPKLARQLLFVLERELWPDWERVPDDPDGGAAAGEQAIVLGTIRLGESGVPVRLVRSGREWRFGPGVVASIPALYSAYGPGWIGERMPRILIEIQFLDVQAWQWIGLLAGLGVALLLALGLAALGQKIVLGFARRTPFTWDELLVEQFAGPARLLLGLFAFGLSASALRLAAPAQEVLQHVLRIGTVALFSWIGIRATGFGAKVLTERVGTRPGDPAARSRLTHVMVLKRVSEYVVIVLGIALVLLQFEPVRALGTSVLASAGVAGIVIGIAAQRSLAALLAGIQISVTQPLRVGDVVVIEREQGTVEEITLSYVVVKIWDLRRLVVPITKILDTPFQVWTRAGSDLIGTVFLHADYRLPIDPVRRELERYVASRPEWDGKVVVLQVTDATERSVQLRALVSSVDASRNWDLRCAVREHLISFIQRLEGGKYLPRARIEPLPQNSVEGAGEEASPLSPRPPT